MTVAGIDPVTSSIYLSRSTGHAISVALDDTRGRGAPLRGIYVIRVAERTDSHRNDSAQRWTDDRSRRLGTRVHRALVPRTFTRGYIGREGTVAPPASVCRREQHLVTRFRATT